MRAQASVVRIPGFDGTNSWEEFQVQLESLGSLHDWSKAEKVNRLTGALRGAQLVQNLPPDNLGSYTALSEALACQTGGAGKAAIC